MSIVGDPVRLTDSSEPDSFARYPGKCPVRLGELSNVKCRFIDGGFLFLQSQGALTDDSGNVYLRETHCSASTWWSTETMIPLGGPWWAWTCDC